ncbi:hypothetical protein MWL72_00555 [Escherichia coli]|nr:hypothetical protein [Escherichia coli]
MITAELLILSSCSQNRHRAGAELIQLNAQGSASDFASGKPPRRRPARF